MNDALRKILGRFELPQAGPITAPEARRFGIDVVKRMGTLGLLGEVTPASTI